jgi:hypothetical protein
MIPNLTHYTLKRCLNDEKTQDTRTGQDLGSREMTTNATEGVL